MVAHKDVVRWLQGMLQEGIRIFGNVILIGGAISLVAGGVLFWDSRTPSRLPAPMEEVEEAPLPDEEQVLADSRNCFACHSPAEGWKAIEGMELPAWHDLYVEPEPAYESNFESPTVASEGSSADTPLAPNPIPDSLASSAAEPAMAEGKVTVQAQPVAPTSVPGQRPSPTPQSVRERGIPTRLVIPDVGIEGKVLAVRASALEGGTDWPIPAEDISWYVGTAIPGDKGNAVMAGHVITRGGGGVFRQLYRVSKDTSISVETTGGTLTYKVVGIRIVSPTDVSVVADTRDAMLTLITCAGDFDSATSTFSHRLVVTARLEPGAARASQPSGKP